MTRYDPLYLKKYSPKKGIFNGDIVRKVVNRLFTRYGYKFFDYNDLIHLLTEYIVIPSKKEVEFINDLRRLQLLDSYEKTSNNTFQLVPIHKPRIKGNFFKLTSNIMLFRKISDPDKALFYSYLNHPIVGLYIEKLYQYKRLEIEKAFDILIEIIQKIDEFQHLANMYEEKGIEVFRRQFLGKITKMSDGELLIKKSNGMIFLEINIQRETLRYLYKSEDKKQSIYVFYVKLKEVYIDTLKKTGFLGEFMKGHSVPVAIGSLWNAYKEKYHEEISLIDFFEKIKQLSKIFRNVSLGFHPVYYDDPKEWYIIITL